MIKFLEKEIWKDIEGYEGLYQVSNLGRIKSLGMRSNHKKEMIMKQQIVRGYKKVTLTKESKPKIYSVHRIVAYEFIENIDDKIEVNHIDGNKLNNCVYNLEWVTPSENIRHAFKLGLKNQKKGKDNDRSIQVLQYDKDNNFICEYGSIREAERETNICHKDISLCVRGRQKSAGGYIWKKK